jgi:HK97 family phage prohead protease
MKTLLARTSYLPWGAKAFDATTGDLLKKSSHGDLQIKASEDPDAPEGTIEGYGSKYGLVDSYGEEVQSGAFRKSLRDWKKRKRVIPMLWQHQSDQPIGGWHDYEEDETGLKLIGQIDLETQRGREAWSAVKGGYVGGLSIGYFEVKADPWSWEPSDVPRKLYELDLREVSVVTFPALREASIDAVKASIARGVPLTIRQFETFLREKLNVSRSVSEEIARDGYTAWHQREVGTSEKSQQTLVLPELKLPDL